MIVGSLLLILVAVALLVGGVVAGSNVLVVACIIVTTVAAITLVVGVRQSANAQADETDDDDEETTNVTQVRSRGSRESRDQRYGDDPSRRDSRDEPSDPVNRGAIPTQSTPDDSETERFVGVRYDGDRLDTATLRVEADRYSTDSSPTESFDAGQLRFEVAQSVAVADLDDEPEDEPSIQIVSPSMASRVAMLTTDVLVIDGRPRYHVTGCVHLIGRESEPLPVAEAVELGFTPCGMCEPDSALLAEARRV